MLVFVLLPTTLMANGIGTGSKTNSIDKMETPMIVEDGC